MAITCSIPTTDKRLELSSYQSLTLLTLVQNKAVKSLLFYTSDYCLINNSCNLHYIINYAIIRQSMHDSGLKYSGPACSRANVIYAKYVPNFMHPNLFLCLCLKRHQQNRNDIASTQVFL